MSSPSPSSSSSSSNNNKNNNNEGVINFYSSREEYAEFSNFAKYPIELKGKRWNTSEHYFQAMKFENTPNEELVRLAKQPREAKDLGGSLSPLREDWEQVKEGVMREALFAKFTQHGYLRELLLSTGKKKLVEHTRNDRYWGDGGDGSGKNRLGVLLMQLRNKLTNPEIKQEKPKEEKKETEKEEETTKDSEIPQSEKETKDKEQEGDEEEKEEEEEEEKGEEDQQDSVEQKQVKQDKYVSAPNPTKPKTAKRGKQWRKRGVFVDKDGSSILEMHDSNHISLLGTTKNQNIVVDFNAIPSAAKLVAHRNQYKKKWQPKAPKDEENEDEEGDEEYKPKAPSKKISFSEFISVPEPTKTPTPIQTPTPTFVKMNTPECIEASKSILELLVSLPKGSSEREMVQNQCQQILPELQRNIEEKLGVDEEKVAIMFQLLDDLTLENK